MTAFLKATAWPMVPLKPYGSFHLIFFFAGLALSVLLAWLLRRTTEKQNNIVLLTVGIILSLFEIYKQLFYTYVIGEGHYQWWIFPFQLCSVPMYLCLVAPFIKHAKIKAGIYDFLLAFNLMGGLVAFSEPSGLIHPYWTLTLHAFIWHMMLIFLGLYIGFTRRSGVNPANYKNAIHVFLIFCLTAFGINLILRIPSGGTINMFFIGPSVSPLIVFKTISEKFGWYINTPIYIFCLCIAAYIFYRVFCVFNGRSIVSDSAPVNLESASVSEEK